MGTTFGCLPGNLFSSVGFPYPYPELLQAKKCSVGYVQNHTRGITRTRRFCKWLYDIYTHTRNLCKFCTPVAQYPGYGYAL